jgi:hypothetical protein
MGFTARFAITIPMGGAIDANYGTTFTYLLLSSPSERAPSAGEDMVCSPAALPSSVDNTSPPDFIDIKTYIDGALTLLGLMRAVIEKMAAAKETKRTTPPACRAVFKRKRLANPTGLCHQEGQSSALACTLELTIHE